MLFSTREFRLVCIVGNGPCRVCFDVISSFIIALNFDVILPLLIAVANKRIRTRLLMAF